MTFEETIAAVFESKLAPFRVEIVRLTSQLEAVSRALPPPLVTMPEAAKALGVSLSTVRRRVRDGSLPVKRVGKGRAVRVDLTGLHAPKEADVVRLAEAAKHG